MKQPINKKGILGTFALMSTASSSNITSGILAYIMVTYSEVSPTTVSMILTIPAIIGTFFAFVSGTIVNKIGVKKVALFAQSCALASGMVYFLFGNKTHIYVLYLAAALYGFLLGGNAVITSQLFKQCVPDDNERGKYLGYGASINSLGGVILSTLGGIIASMNNGLNWNRAYLLFLWMVPCLILEFLLLPNEKPVTVKKEKVDQTKTSKLPFKVYLIAAHYLFFFLFLFVFSLNVSEYVITTHHLGTSAQSGLALSCLTVGGIVSGLCFGTYEGFLRDKTMTCLLCICTLGIALIVFVPNIYVLFVASSLLGFAMSGCGPFVTVQLARITDEQGYAKAMSIYSGFMNGGMMVAVYIIAFLSTIFFGTPDNVDGKFIIALVGLILVTIASVPLYVRKKKVR